MPRHLRAAVASVASWPESDPSQPHPLQAEPAGEALVAYFNGAAGWHLLGFELDHELCKEIAGLAARRPDLRGLLFQLIGFYPCDAFRRIFRRHAEQGGHGDFVGWLEAFPEMHESIKTAVIARAGRFNHASEAVDACLIWGRYFGGGDAAWRQIACVMKREDRRQAQRELPSDYLRHDLETHGTVTPDEASAINRFLDELKETSLSALGNAGWEAGYRSPPPDFWRQEAYRGRVLENAVRGSRTLAGDGWSAEDVELFAQALSGMNSVERSSYRTDGRGVRCSGALREVAERAAALTAGQ
jgi:hypothetical protein